MENNVVEDYQLPVVIRNYKNFNDFRGSFKILNKELVPSRYRAANEFDWAGYDFQENVSVSHPGVLRGMHWQVQFPQAKLVKVLYGAVLDVVVDIRPKSPTFKQAFSFNLTDNGEQLFIPRGFAHGFYNYGDTDAVFHYNVDNEYFPMGERGIKWSSIDFTWPIPKGEEPILSNKDRLWPCLNDVPESDFDNLC